MAFIITALRRIGRGIFSRLFEAVFFASLLFWDFSLAIVNTFTFKRKIGSVTPKGSPGEGGVWPKYTPPSEGDSRCSCPGLNTLANHGIISRDGRDISFRELSDHVRSTYNFSPTFSLFVPRFIARILKRSYRTGRFDLADIDVHNGIEHDASLVRRDTFLQIHQGLPDADLVAALIKSATGPPPKKKLASLDDELRDPLPPKDSPYFHVAAQVAKATTDFDLNRTLTPRDLSRRLGQRRREAQADNGQYSQDTGHKMFGSSNASTLLTIFGGRMDDIYTFLTLFAFNRTVFRVELGIEEEVNQSLHLM
ncbi:Cloroperoxidase [Multifurca ochricompacta]|uniref:Cloroperoxidase n=1 Tax=Multifurca ochricompacta TaxID=376703 RepID=A0AAD4M229_9AGAM|nr:Cloroperoxidase [Multifurca ochricompacta]